MIYIDELEQLDGPGRAICETISN